MHSRKMRYVILTCMALLGTIGLAAQPRVIHVLVALCDNEHQGIVKVPVGIGNGQKASTNLYWGAGYGVKTHFDRSAEWIRVASIPATEAHILDRAVWKHKDSAVYLVADAYDGRNIREATEDLLRFASGAGTLKITANGTTINAGGAAHLVAYVGHNGLMDFSLQQDFPATQRGTRETIILGCISKRYFAEPLRNTLALDHWTDGPRSLHVESGAEWLGRARTQR